MPLGGLIDYDLPPEEQLRQLIQIISGSSQAFGQVPGGVTPQVPRPTQTPTPTPAPTRMPPPEHVPPPVGTGMSVTDVLSHPGEAMANILNVLKNVAGKENPLAVALRGAGAVSGAAKNLNNMFSDIGALQLENPGMFGGPTQTPFSVESIRGNPPVGGGASVAPRAAAEPLAAVAARLGSGGGSAYGRMRGSATPSVATERTPISQMKGAPVLDALPMGRSQVTGPGVDLGSVPDHAPVQAPEAEVYPPDEQASAAAATKGPSVGMQLLNGLIEQLPQMLVNFTAAKFDRPDIAEDFLRRRALQIESATKAAEMQAQRASDDRQAIMQMLTLETTRAGHRRQIVQQASDLQGRVAEGKLTDPVAYVRGMQALASEMASMGGDPDDFVANFPVPQWDALQAMRKQAMELVSQYAGKQDVLSRAMIVNPMTGQPITAIAALEMLNGVNADGTVEIPAGVIRPTDVREVTTRDAAGTETTTLKPITDIVGKPQVKRKMPPEAWRSMVVKDDSDGVTRIYGIQQGQQPIVLAELNRGPQGLEGLVQESTQLGTNVSRNAVASAILEDRLKRPPTGPELTAFTKSKEGIAQINQILGIK